MKKYIFIFIISLFFITGCGKYSEKDVVNDLDKKIKKLNSYYINGSLEIVNNDNVYNYKISVGYKKNNNYRINITNTSNNHTQIILKNKDGVFLLTPSLNKSFKFQSDWPYDNSQIYLLSSIINDIKKDDDRKFKVSDKYYTFITTVNYPNNPNLVKQKVIFDKKLNIKKVIVYDKNNTICMSMIYKNIDYSPSFKKNYFNIDSIIKNEDIDKEETKKSSSIDDTIYPLFIPNGTKLVNEERIKKDSGERIIMTFDGDKSFLLVEETANTESQFTIIPTYGEPFRLLDTIGVMTNNSLSWTTGNIEYYIVSDVLDKKEMIDVAQSISVVPTMK